MGNISSANFKKSKDWQVFHNADERPSYAIGGKLEVNRNGLDALNLKKQIIQDAKNAYERNRKPKSPNFRATSYEWSLVVNLKESSTMQDLETLSKHFSDKYGFQCYQIAIHRDEGHINEQGEKIINHHAHLEFITLDKETGRNRFRGDFVTPKNFRIVQDEVAQILQMKRGIDKRLSGAKRIEPRVFAAIKEQQKREIKALKNEFLSQKEVNARIGAEREARKNQGYTNQFFRDLTPLKKRKYANHEELEEAIQETKQHDKERQEIQKKQKELESKNQEITQLRQENQQMQNVLNAQQQEQEKQKKEKENIDRQKRELESTLRFLHDDSKDQIQTFFEDKKSIFTTRNKIHQECQQMKIIVANIVNQQTQKLQKENKELTQNLQEKDKELAQSNEKLNYMTQRISEKNEVLNKYDQEIRKMMSWEDYCKLTNTPNTDQERHKFFGREMPQNTTKQRSR